MQIASYLKTSLIEWPGKISSVIFVPGCNFRCPFCHNADLVLGQGFSRIPKGQIFADLEKRKEWTEAAIITGGEPTLQEDLPKFLKDLKQLGLLTMVHTNGTRPEVIEKLIKDKLIDYWAMDLKGDLENYGRYIGVQSYISKIKVSLDLIANSGVEYEFRTTVVPGLHDQKNLIVLAEQIKFLEQSAKCKVQSCRWYLQQFRPMNTLDKNFLKVQPYSKEKMVNFQNELKKIIPGVFLRGF